MSETVQTRICVNFPYFNSGRIQAEIVMKVLQNSVLVAVALCGLSVASAAAISDSSPTASSSANTTGVASGSAFVPLSSTTDAGIPTSTGGYVVTGVYTTCLTLTFAAPTPTNPGGPIITVNPGGPITPVSSASVTPSISGVNPSGPIESESVSARGNLKHASSLSVNPGGPSGTVTPVSASGSSVPSGTNPGGSVIPGPYEVFTTCLIFLPSATATDTATPVTGVLTSASASASESVVGSVPVASSSVAGLQ
ncbi:hypothetical protein C8R45DRAFT_639904 [Mycena sanguinolenta]|nr:hypothetical protein C8R45DRAFT_639904 [Mycena sanguinolenta]